MKRTKLPARKKPIRNTRTPNKGRKPLKRGRKKKSKLAIRKGTSGSKYWRNKADAEITRLMTGLPCKVCDVTRGTAGHHLIPKGRCAIHRHTLENLYPLCQKHHLRGNVISAHSQSAMVMQRFISWMEDNDPERLQWMRTHEFDKGKPDYQSRYEYLKTLNRL